jgi:O-antigen/teichoic acid export membrane protein
MKKILALVLAILFLIIPISGKAQSTPLAVFYIGADDGVKTALTLNPNAVLVTDPSKADVIVLNGIIPEDQTDTIRVKVQAGAGLVVITGPNLSADALSRLLGEKITFSPETIPLTLEPAKESEDLLVTQVLWSSAPQVLERSSPSSGNFASLVSGYEDGSLHLGKMQLGNGLVYLLDAHMGDKNPEYQQWPYFNYLIYALTEQASGGLPLPFASYSASPVPHSAERNVLLGLMALLVVTSFVIFWVVRRYSLRHPEALNKIVINREEFAAREEKTAWEDIGFHRPLGGFFVLLFFGLILFVPIIIYQNVVLPVLILPSAQAIGMWGRVTQFFTLIWTLFDMGTSVAFIKYLSEYRINEPRRGILFGQWFVWWQALSGAVQVAIVIILSCTVLPKTAFAIYSWSVITHTFIQIPGFYRVIRHALTGLQRSDYAQVIDLGWSVGFQMVAQPICVAVMLVWGRSHPAFGMTMSGLIGLGIAAYLVEVMAFILGLILYRRLGYNAKIYFLAHFDWNTIWKSFKFGIFEMLGGAAWGLGQSMEVLITQTRLLNSAEVWGNWVLAQNFVTGFGAIAQLFEGMMPSVSEAISHGKKILSQYYSAIAYKWGGLLSAMIGSILLAVADRFILGASGPQFIRAAGYSIPLLLWGALQYPSWIGDMVQRGSNKPWLMVLMVGLEQIIRITLALVLIATLQINAIIIAYFIGILTKDIVSYFVNNKVCYPQRFYFWQSLAAPILAGGLHYLIIRWVTGFIWQGDQITSIIIFFIGICLSYPLFAFIYALVGGWDDGTLEELKKAAGMASFMKFFAWVFWWASNLGARISPLHGRFPISIREAALEEAKQLQQERVSLVN